MKTNLQTRLNRLPMVDYDSVLFPVVNSVEGNRVDRHSKEGQINMDVSGVGPASGGTPIRGIAPTTSQPVASPSVAAPRDELEISSAGKMLDRLSESPEVRAERLAQIKEAIENGTYDTDEKLEAALSRMFDSLGIDADDE